MSRRKYNLPALDKPSLNKTYEEESKLVPTSSGVTLEGQLETRPDLSRPRGAFTLTQIENGRVLRRVTVAPAMFMAMGETSGRLIRWRYWKEGSGDVDCALGWGSYGS
ncbi:hypothetical protein IFM58399_04697 [Aspergillus lentulus]|nr:uncharacterized protein IFM58399_04697 [Aspergillus lentulus]KAF4152584.1 hypothetical protein CNMCM6069_001908 [Aspergillus lentulus]KAF4161933.1 hypothetical protein CNMCM6936_002851 [Aspergillus lentulus]KAF4171686.1 hypothetical protein CNMCM8060_002585 [Aspergillus lentulus]KAF4179297.1 hypothetical protein CNMCM7927_001916 [Aspergillus lentulus]KAF4191210.1 hypothetical protein CNMCM8694_002254 [Aspergillus lentulus]